MIKVSTKVKNIGGKRLENTVTHAVDRSLWDAMQKVQRRSRDVYKANIHGYTRLSKFLKTSRDRFKKGDVQLNLQVSAAEGKRRGADITKAIGGSSRGGKRAERVRAWDDIAYQIEYGTTRKGQKTIRSRSQLMSIPIHTEAKNKSPRDFPYGKWINIMGTSYFVTLARGGAFRKPVPPRKLKGPLKNASKPISHHQQRAMPTEAKYKFLFMGVHEVNVKSPKPYWRPTLKTMFGEDGKSGEMLRILKKELGQDFEVR